MGSTVFNQKYFSLPKSYFAALQLWCDGNDAPEWHSFNPKSMFAYFLLLNKYVLSYPFCFPSCFFLLEFFFLDIATRVGCGQKSKLTNNFFLSVSGAIAQSKAWKRLGHFLSALQGKSCNLETLNFHQPLRVPLFLDHTASLIRQWAAVGPISPWHRSAFTHRETL